MSESAKAKIAEMKKRLETDAARVTTRDDLIRLRMFWNDLTELERLDNEPSTE